MNEAVSVDSILQKYPALSCCTVVSGFKLFTCIHVSMLVFNFYST